MKVIKVDENDGVLGSVLKDKAHSKEGVLHRAISVFVFNKKGELLIQRRSRHKRLWPLYWSNTCCSHPFEGEGYVEAGGRRLEEEMGFKCGLKSLFKYRYEASYRNVGMEKEITMVLVGKVDDVEVVIDKDEVDSYRWVKLPVLKKEIEEERFKFTPWFKGILESIEFNEAL